MHWHAYHGGIKCHFSRHFERSEHATDFLRWCGSLAEGEKKERRDFRKGCQRKEAWAERQFTLVFVHVFVHLPDLLQLVLVNTFSFSFHFTFAFLISIFTLPCADIIIYLLPHFQFDYLCQFAPDQSYRSCDVRCPTLTM